MIGLPWSQEGLCYRRDRNFFHSSNSLQLGGRPSATCLVDKQPDTDMNMDTDMDMEIVKRIKMRT